MPGYSYKVADTSGKIIKGTLKAEDETGAVRILQKQGYIPIRIQLMEDGPGTDESRLTRWLSSLLDRVSSKDVMVFTQDLAVLLEAGLPLDRALSILIDVAEKDRVKGIIDDVLKLVQGGAYLSDAMAKHPEAFSDFYINMVKAGEIGGVLPDVLNRLGLSLESSQELRDFIVSAMIYPLFLVLVGGASLVVLLTFVIPKFSVIFSDMGTALPFSTKVLLTLSTGLKNWWWLIPTGIAAVAFLYDRYTRTPNGRLRLDRLKLRLPMMGELITKVETVRFARTLGVLLKSGVSILMALDLVRATIANKVLADAMKRVHARVKEGDRLSKSLEEAGILPALGLQMIIVGEESGRLEEMLSQVAGSYEKSVKETVKRLTALLEPVMILFMGLVVGFVVISMLMGIFSMNDIPF
ncbi:MAG: type II secretion system F family protein [Deltaproteobacteria bacterium]|nr:type II secretion system F family protein [Deltaproteobacteria bacterium]